MGLHEGGREEALQYFHEAYEAQMAGDLERAVRLYTLSIEIHPTAEAYTFRGWTYSFQKRYEDAIRECEKAIETDPDFGNPYNDIGAYLIELGRQDEAIPWLEKAARAKRYESYCFPHYNLGRIWEAKGDWAKAVDCYRRSLAENPAYSLASEALNKMRGMMN